jgi:hypothetical protein
MDLGFLVKCYSAKQNDHKIRYILRAQRHPEILCSFSSVISGPACFILQYPQILMFTHVFTLVFHVLILLNLLPQRVSCLVEIVPVRSYP